MARHSGLPLAGRRSLLPAASPTPSSAPAALEEDCRSADIVIVPFTVGKGCGAARVVVDRKMLWSEGAYALYIEGLSIRSESVAEARGNRPWVPDRPMVKPAPGQSSGQAYARDPVEPDDDLDARVTRSPGQAGR